MRTIGDSTSDTSALSVTSEPETIRVIENTTDGRAIVVDDPAVLFLGDYSRQGNDLLIEHEGESHLIADYFGSATPANLAAPNGAFLEADLVSTLAGDPFGGQYAQAGGGNAAQIGKVIKLEGAATSTSADGTKTPLAIDTPVYQGDVIETGAGSKLGISFVDKTVFSMSADARMVLDELIFDPANVGNSSMNFNLVQGAFVFVTGDIAPTGNMKIDTPVATMGIRGTTPRVVINTDLGVSEFTILPDPDTGKIGSYVIINKETGAILGTVRSTADKWVVTSLSNEAVKINKTGLDLLEDQVALDEIQDVFSRSLGDRAEIDGANSFQRIGFDATASDDGDGPEDGGAGDDPNGDGGVLADGSNNDDPPVASDDEFATDDNTTISTGLNVVVNDNNNGVDIDPEGFPINVSQINGQDLVFVGSVASVPLPSGAILLIESDGDITYSPNGAYDFLGLNDVDQDIFEYTIVDDGGQTDIGTITVTLTGRNEQPVVTNVDISGFSDSFTENADTGNNTNIRMAFGEVEFADTDASDTHTPSAGAPDVVWTQGSGAEVDLGPIGSIALTLTETSADPAPVLTFNPGPPPVLTSRPAPVEGDVAWQYSVAEADIDFLALGETLTLIYPITITDDSGVGGGNSGDEPDSVTQNVVITITGTNDAPQIGVLTDVDHTFTDGSALLSTSGSFGVIDVDVTDVVSITDVSVVTAGQDTDAQGADLSNAELLDLFVPRSGVEVINGETTGTVSWDFNAAANTFDYLALGETLTLTYTITLTDDNGANSLSETQDVVITIEGTNQEPIITVNNPDDVAETFVDGSALLSTDGSFIVSDVDTTDIITIAGITVLTDGQDVDAQNAHLSTAGLLDLFSPRSGVEIPNNDNEGVVEWTFNADAQTFDYLALGETLTVTYRVETLTDDNGPDSLTAIQDIVITIEGTNQQPQITVNNPADVAETFTDGSVLLATNGSFDVSDVDTTDVVTISGVTVATVGQDSDAQGAALDDTALLALFTPKTGVEVTGTDNAGTVTWDFTAAAQTFDYLALGETLTLTYTVTLTDDNGASSLTNTQDVTITIEGTNQQPQITVNNPADVAETFTDGSVLLATNGSFDVSDVDTTDVVTISGVTVATAGQDSDTQGAALDDTALLALFTPKTGVEVTGTDNAGTVTWDFTAAAQTFDYLALGETLTLTYTVTLTDDNGASSLTNTQDVTITIEGTNQQPQITVNNPADVAETFTDGSVLLATNGSFDVSDVDTTDVVTISGVTVATVGQDSDAQGAALDDTALLALFTPKTGVEVTGTDNAGTVTWDFNAAAQTFDYLALGETLTLTYTVTLTDDNGASSLTNTQDVTITIEGTNQQPVISLVGTDSATSALTEGIAPLTDSGTISVSDADTTDTVSVALDGVTVGGTGAGVNPLTTAALEGFFSVGPVPVVGTAGNEGDIAWSFDSGSEIFDFLAKDETLELTYKVDVSDGNGGTATTDVVVTITGTNDAPTGLTPAFNYTLTEDTGIVSGNLGVSVAFSGADAPQDVDASDILSGNVSYNNDATWSGGTLSAAQIAALTAQISVVSANQWDYKVANADVQFLKAGETITLSFGFNATDDSGAANNSTQTQTVTITIQGTGETPVISSSTSAFTYVEGDGARAIDSTISLSDVDSTTLTGATVTIGTGFQAGTDTLEFVNQNGISGILINNVLTLSGTANVADYEAALQSVAFQVEPGALTPLNATREFSFSVTDDAGLGSNVTTVTAAVSNANIINGTPGNDQGTASLYGTGANDRIRGFAGNDEIEGQGGNDIIDGGTGSDIIGGGAGDDIIFTDGDFNDIAGGPGNDYLLAVGNFNNLEGGSGNDEFQILAGSLGTTIADYTEGEDVINLETLLGPSSGFDPNDPTSTISVESDGLNPATLAVDGQNLAMLESVSPGEFISIIYDSSQAAIQVEVQFGSGGGPS